MAMLLVVAVSGCTASNQDANTNTANTNTAVVEEATDLAVTLSTSGADLNYNLDLTVPAESTVSDIMTQAQTDGEFEYEATTYEGMGEVVDAIGGVASDIDTNQYWILYVNDEMAIEGMSTLEVMDGDVVEWKYEAMSM